jgi:hypothetical protein
VSRPGPVVALLAWCIASPALAAQTTTPGRALADAPQLRGPLIPGDTVEATPFARYGANALHRWILGDGHRALWALPARAPVLDLSTFAGGLVPVRTGGGLQTRSLVFEGADGQQWRFRSIDKDAARTLDPTLRETLAAWVVQDQIAHLFPMAATVVARLLEAADVLHPSPTLVVVPDDPRLGEFREDFRGMLGWMEVRPDEAADGGPGFAGSGRVIGSDRLLERLEEKPGNRVDARAYLRARLMDALVGDWDRHPDQWRWAGLPDGDDLVFHPVPRDRDWALSRLDGLTPHFTWIPWPHYVGFRSHYPPAFRLTWSGRVLDRRLLSGLDRAAWREEALALRERLGDPVVAEAVARLPTSYPADVGAELEDALTRRRDALPEFAEEYYELLAGWVDVHTTDHDEVATAHWLEGDRLVLRVRPADPEAPTRFERTFVGGETREVRLFLHGGDDRLEVVGQAPSSITLRVVGGGGDDRLRTVEGGGGEVRLYDARGENRFETGPRTDVDTRPWREPVDPNGNTHRAGHRDWGARTLLLPSIRFDPDLGVFGGSTLEHVTYGFRRYPFRIRFGASVAVASGTGQPDVVLDADLPVADLRDVRVRIRTRIWGTEFHRFYGFGNDTPADDPAGKRAYQAPRRVLGLEAALRWAPMGSPWSAALEGGLRGHHPHRQGGTLIEALQPYGTGEFEEFVFALRVRADTRDRPAAPREGFLLDVGAELGPRLLDVASTYGAGGLRAEAHWRAGRDVRFRPGLSLRAGGRWVWGQAPYHAAATVGGPPTVRGLRTERLTGDASLFAGAEFRVSLAELVLLLPGEAGLLALADAGRVFLDGRSPGGWHQAWGGGVWLDLLDTFALTLSAARGPEDTLVYLTLGLPF